MTAFWHYALMAVKRRIAYRTAEMAGLVTNMFWCAIRTAVLLGVLGSRSAIVGYGRGQMLLYVGLTQALFPCLGLFGWWDLMKAVRTGEVITDYCKPLGFYGMWQAGDLGRAVYQLISRGVPMMGFTAVVFRVDLPGPWSTWLVFGISLSFAYVTSFAWRFMYNSIAFWIVDARGIVNMACAITTLLAGLMVPVAFFPAWLKTLAGFTPFPSMLNTPIEILLKIAPGAKIPTLLAGQAAWAAGMVLLAQWVARRGMRKVAVQGG